MMDRVGLFEKDTIGDHFTWSNKHSQEVIYSRIDRVVGNIQWHKKYIDTTLKIMKPSVSYHALLYIQRQTNRKILIMMFKFPNIITEKYDFMEVVTGN